MKNLEYFLNLDLEYKKRQINDDNFPNVSNLILGVDASRNNSLFQNSNGTVAAIANNDPVGYWGDRSGLSHNAIQAIADSRPLLKLTGLPAIQFDNIDDYLGFPQLTGAFSLGISWYIVMSLSDGRPLSSRALFGGLQTTGTLAYIHTIITNGGLLQWLLKSGSTITNTVQTLADGQSAAFIFSGRATPNGDMHGRFNRTAVNTISIAAINWGNISSVNSEIFNLGMFNANGGQSPGVGYDVHEFLVYNVPLVDLDDTIILDYLATKWGTP